MLKENQLVRHKINGSVGQVLKVVDVPMGSGRILEKVKVLWLRPDTLFGKTNILVAKILEPVTQL